MWITRRKSWEKKMRGLGRGEPPLFHFRPPIFRHSLTPLLAPPPPAPFFPLPLPIFLVSSSPPPITPATQATLTNIFSRKRQGAYSYFLYLPLCNKSGISQQKVCYIRWLTTAYGGLQRLSII